MLLRHFDSLSEIFDYKSMLLSNIDQQQN